MFFISKFIQVLPFKEVRTKISYYASRTIIHGTLPWESQLSVEIDNLNHWNCI